MLLRISNVFSGKHLCLSLCSISNNLEPDTTETFSFLLFIITEMHLIIPATKCPGKKRQKESYAGLSITDPN